MWSEVTRGSPSCRQSSSIRLSLHPSSCVQLRPAALSFSIDSGRPAFPSPPRPRPPNRRYPLESCLAPSSSSSPPRPAPPPPGERALTQPFQPRVRLFQGSITAPPDPKPRAIPSLPRPAALSLSISSGPPRPSPPPYIPRSHPAPSSSSSPPPPVNERLRQPSQPRARLFQRLHHRPTRPQATPTEPPAPFLPHLNLLPLAHCISTSHLAPPADNCPTDYRNSINSVNISECCTREFACVPTRREQQGARHPAPP